MAALHAGKEIPRNSCILGLTPELDPDLELIRVAGRLRKLAQGEAVEIDPYPIFLDQHHSVTKLLIKDADHHFSHQAGTGQVFAHLRRRLDSAWP